MTITEAHPFSLRQMQYAVAVAETLSFRRASELCHVAQPSLSAQIAQMETALGVALFERNRKRVLITPAGNEILERARVLLRDAADIARAARRLGDPLSVTLRLGVIPTISAYLLPHAAPSLAKAFPRLSVQWLEEKTERLVQQLQDGTLDGAIVAREAQLGDVVHQEIAKDEFVLAAPWTARPGREAAALPLSELRGEHVLLLAEGHCLHQQISGLCTRAKASESEFHATSLPTLVQMVAAGAGITLLPKLALTVERQRARLRIRTFQRPVPHRTIVLIWRNGSPLQETMRKVAAEVRAAYPSDAR